MKLRINKRMNGKYFIQKRFMFIWFECTNLLEISSLLADGVSKEFYTLTSAKHAIKDMLATEEVSKKFDDEYDRGQEIDFFFKPIYYKQD